MKGYTLVVLLTCIWWFGGYYEGKWAADRWYKAHPKTVSLLEGSANTASIGAASTSTKDTEGRVGCKMYEAGHAISWSEQGQICHALEAQRIQSRPDN